MSKKKTNIQKEKMNLIDKVLNGVFIIQPRVFGDDRGLFFESYNQERFNQLIGTKVEFVQDNQSKSAKGVLRGLHFQAPPHAQGKLVSVAKGSALDVMLDIRKDSITYGKFHLVKLTDKNYYQVYIPPGFAHGFVALEDDTIFTYKCTSFYNKESEGCILWNDTNLGIDWKVENPIVSDKDALGEAFKGFVSPF